MKVIWNGGETYAGLEQAVLSVLGPGEGLLAACSFSASKTLALSNSNIHIITIYDSGRSICQVSGHTQIPLSAVSGVTTGGGTGVSLSFSCEGRIEKFHSQKSNGDEARRFIKLFRDVLLKKEIQKESSAADEIEKFSKLASEGILSGEELTRAKEMFIGRPPNHIDQSVQLLRNLKELQRQGVLSESEFNMKKWDILSKSDFK